MTKDHGDRVRAAIERIRQRAEEKARLRERAAAPVHLTQEEVEELLDDVAALAAEEKGDL
jgi:hypothetical protein